MIIPTQPVPLVDRHQHAVSGLGGNPHELEILIDDAFTAIEHKNHHVRFFHGLQGLHHRELLCNAFYLALPPYARRIDQHVGLTIPFERNGDGISGGTRRIKNHLALFAQQAIGQRGLAHVGTTNDGNTNAIVVRVRQLDLAGHVLIQIPAPGSQPAAQLTHAAAMGC